MALPVLNAPTHELTLTSTGETIQFRPFLVKEEKILLMALESGDDKEMMRATKQIISNCVTEEIDIEKLPIFDIQYIFLKLRGQSIGDVVTLRFKHRDEKNEKGEVCDHIQEVNVDLSKIKPEPIEGHEKKIQLSDNIGVVMKYPQLDTFQKISNYDFENKTNNTFDAIFDIMSDSLEMIYQDDEVFYKDDHTNEEIMEFFGSLNTKQFEKIRTFFTTMPYLRHEFDYTCEKCGCKEHVVLNGIEDFFA